MLLYIGHILGTISTVKLRTISTEIICTMQPLTGTLLFFFLMVRGKNGDNKTSQLLYFIVINFIKLSVMLVCGSSGNGVEIMIFDVSDF